MQKPSERTEWARYEEYRKRLTNPLLGEELQSRLERIDLDGLMNTGDLEEYLLEKSSPFPQLLATERPDRFAMELLQGRAGLLVDGLPLGFLLPATLAETLRVPEDTAAHYTVASVLTLLRYLALFLSVLLPALYVAVTMYHQEMVPTRLLLSIIQSKQDVPFSTAGETLGMLVAFELLQEAGLRLPATIGQSVSIIGALIVGQSAVEAKVISPVVVIVVAIAGITGYTMPNQDMAAALRLCRFGMVILSVGLGLFGMVTGHKIQGEAQPQFLVDPTLDAQIHDVRLRSPGGGHEFFQSRRVDRRQPGGVRPLRILRAEVQHRPESGLPVKGRFVDQGVSVVEQEHFRLLHFVPHRWSRAEAMAK